MTTPEQMSDAELIARLRAELDEMAHARRAIERERDLMGRRVEQSRRGVVVYVERIQEVEAERDRLRSIAEEALHLRMNGECAPGGTETWAAWDRKAEAALRGLDGTEAGT